MFLKKKRIVDRKLIEQVKQMKCLACGSLPPVDADHITTRGAGGDDTEDNLMPLCRRCHTLRHKLGIKTFAKKFLSVRRFLILKKRFDVID